MDSVSIDWVSVLVAAILNMIVNFFWYSKWLFGRQWAALTKMKEEKVKSYNGAVAWSLITSIIMAFFLAWFERQLGVVTVQDGMFVGFCVWLGFITTSQSAALIWCKEPFSLFMIKTGNRLLAFLVMGGVLGA